MSATRRRLLVGLAAALALGAACTGPSATPSPQTPSSPRLVSLTPAITETVARLGALDTLVARSQWCTLPPEVTALPAVGSGLTPELERIVALRPTGILLDASLASRTDDLRGLAPVHVLPWLTAPEIAASLRTLGPLVGRPDAAEALAARFDALPDAPPPEAPVVLLTLTTDPADGQVWYIKRNSVHGTLLHAAGARNAVDRDEDGAPTLSLEALVALDPPTIVVLSAQPVDEAARQRILGQWRGMEALQAVRNGRVAVLGGPEVLSTGPSALDQIQPLHDAIAALAGGTPR